MTTQNRPNVYRLTHQWGSTTMPLIDPDTGLVTTLLVERDGERRNAYITELQPNRDTIFLEGAGVAKEQVSSAYILSLLKSENPGYQQHRSAFFVEQGFLDDKTTYETTRLRADLYTAVAAQRPDLFKPEELANLPGYVFKKHMANRPVEISPEDAGKWRLDFSQDTVKGVASYIREKSAEAGAWRYTGLKPVYKWLSGETIHPTHNSRKSEQIKDVSTADLAEDVVAMARALGADDLAVRASDIADTERKTMGDDYARRGSPYFEIVDAHRSAVRDMRGIMREVGDDKPAAKKAKTKKGRVHDEMPEWKARLLEKLEPLLENKVVGSRFYGFDLVEMAERGEETGKPVHGLPIRVLTTTNEERAKRTYASAGIMQAPSRRSASLRTSLLRSYELLGEIYKAAVPLYISGIQEDLGGRIRMLPRNVNTSFKHTRTNDNSSMACIQTDDMRYLSPAFGYSHSKLIDTWVQWMRLVGNAKADRNFRRNFVRALNSDLPDNHPAAGMLKEAYFGSALLKKLFGTERTFAREITTGMRRVDASEMEAVTGFSPAQFTEMHRSAGEKYKTLSMIFSDLGRACAEPIEELKVIDKQIPNDVTLFRLFTRSMSANLDILNIHERERAMFRQVVSMYGIDPSEVMSAYEDVILKTAQATHNRIRELKEKHQIKSRFVSAMVDLSGRIIDTVDL
ncbi:MAG: hypothetical protein HY516_05265 [Candidatus Aenigmarchaeota archaeon]|nr:hypothetical protein [Candidatus Aenigmarchaeota archaeon]